MDLNQFGSLNCGSFTLRIVQSMMHGEYDIQYFNISIFQYFNISIFQYFNISIFQYFNISIFQYFKAIVDNLRS